MGVAWQAIYKGFVEMQEVFPALENIVWMLNMETDVHQRAAISRHLLRAEEYIHSIMQNKTGFYLDRLPVFVRDVEFELHNRTITLSGVISVCQGTFVWLLGPEGGGKGTLLKLLGNNILPLPNEGFFIPPSLRVLHVSDQPVFFFGSFYENIIFGVSAEAMDGDKMRVKKICEYLNIPDFLIRQITEPNVDPRDGSWLDMISYSQRRMCSLVRALVANPQLLCIHKPTMACDIVMEGIVLQLLSDFVKLKGVEQDPARRHFRRPRTCIITTSRINRTVQPDEVYHVSRISGIARLDSLEGLADEDVHSDSVADGVKKVASAPVIKKVSKRKHKTTVASKFSGDYMSSVLSDQTHMSDLSAEYAI